MLKMFTKPANLVLAAEKAEDLMTPNPVSLPGDADWREALVLFTNRAFSAAPVIDEAGRPIGVLSRTDLIVHDRERLRPVPDFENDLMPLKEKDNIRVRDLMTPAVFSVAPDDPAEKVVREMVALNVHRLFVINKEGVLVGVVSAMDVLKNLTP